MNISKLKKFHFKNLNVYPASEKITPAGNNFGGGPDWPNFYFNIQPRYCVGPIPIAVDKRPTPLPYKNICADGAIWCGPIVKHFGHMISDHLTRLLISKVYSEGRHLVFSVPENYENYIPEFFWQIVDLWNINRDRILIISEPTKFEDIIVYPQQERRIGGSPSDFYLDLLDNVTEKKDRKPDKDVLYVSRSNYLRGVIAGETYIDKIFNQSGHDVFYPEKFSVQQQIAKYRSYKKIVFSEGSALHAIQLVGRIEADIFVIMRRPFFKLASASLIPRANSVTYINAIEYVFSGLTRNYVKHYQSAITFINFFNLLKILDKNGIFISRNINVSDFFFHEAVAIHKWLHFLKAATQNRQELRNIIEKLNNLTFFNRYREHAHLFDINKIWNT